MQTKKDVIRRSTAGKPEVKDWKRRHKANRSREISYTISNTRKRNYSYCINVYCNCYYWFRPTWLEERVNK